MIEKVIKNDYFLSMVNKIFGLLSGVVFSALVNRTLGTELKGEYTYYSNIISIAVIILNMGLYQSYPKSYKDGLSNLKGKYLFLFLIQFLLYIGISLMVCVIPGNMWNFVIILTVPAQILATQLSMIALVECIRYRQIIQILSQILKMVLIIVVYFCSPSNLISVFTVLLIFNISQCVMYVFKLYSRKVKLEIDKKFMKYVLKFGILAMISTLLIMLNYKLDVIMLKRYVDYSQIGLYSVGAALAEYVWLVPDIFRDVLFSRNSRKNAIQEINMAIKISVLVSVVAFAGMLVLGKMVIRLYSGVEYLDAYGVTLILFLGVPSMSLFKVTNTLYLANGKQKMYCLILLGSAIANIVMNMVLIPCLGIYGAAVASVISFSICGILFYSKYVKDYKIKWYEPLIFTRKDIIKIKNMCYRIFN